MQGYFKFLIVGSGLDLAVSMKCFETGYYAQPEY
jgi:hypothetical protein